MRALVVSAFLLGVPSSGCGGGALPTDGARDGLGSCATSADCPAGQVCGRFGGGCVPAAQLRIGDPCTAHTQCSTGQCFGWCASTCVTDVDCGDSNICSFGDCYPLCGLTDCSVYGADYACRRINGSALPVCTL